MNQKKTAFSLLLFLAVLLGNFPIIGQNRVCTTMDHALGHFSDKETAYNRYLEHLSGICLKSSSSRSGVYIIPVVFHIVHNGQPIGVEENVSNNQIFAQLRILNEDFRRRNSDSINTPAPFKPLAADVEVEFVMASVTQDGLPFSGINRINGQRAFWDELQVNSVLKPATQWNPDKYLNIWVVKFGGNSSQTLGYSSLPGLGPSNQDGVVISHRAFGEGGTAASPYNKGRTGTHEVGHWLGLVHIWGDDGGLCTGSDNINDTPNQAGPNYGCPPFPTITCNNGPHGDMFMNYMDYTNDACMNLFTQGQKQRMRNILETFRTSILSSEAAIPFTDFSFDAAILEILNPGTVVCENLVMPKVRLINLGNQPLSGVAIQYQLNDEQSGQFIWTGYLPLGQTADFFLPSFTPEPGQNTYRVTTGQPNGQTDQNPGNDETSVNFLVVNPSFGRDIPSAEGFEQAGFPPNEWLLFNPNNNLNWERTESASGAGQSTASIFFDNFSGGSNISGDTNSIQSPAFRLQGSNYPLLTFRYAYSQKGGSNDRLAVSWSPDCGNTWHLLWSKEGNDLATAPSTNAPFVPAAAQWKEAEIDLNPIKHYGRVLFRFSNISDGGNRLYLDDIFIKTAPAGIFDITASDWAKLLPNPAREALYIQVQQPCQNCRISVYSPDGRMVLQENESIFPHEAVRLDISKLSPGLYLLNLQDNRKHFRGKFIKQ